MKIMSSRCCNTKSLALLVLLVLAWVVWAGPSAAQAPLPTNSMGTVTASALRVRVAPTTSSRIITVAARGELFPVVGRNAESSWWQVLLSPEGATGWVHGAYLNVAYKQGVPVTSPGGRSRQQPPPGPGGYGHFWSTVVDVNIRSGPGAVYSIVGGMFGGMPVNSVGRNASGTWVQIRTDDGRGWITRTALPPYANVSVLPVTE